MISRVRIKPYSPKTNGKAERFIRLGYAEPYNKQLASPQQPSAASGVPEDNLLSSTTKA